MIKAEKPVAKPKAEVVSDLPGVDKEDFSEADAQAHADKSIPIIDDKFVANLGSEKMYGKVKAFSQVVYDVQDKQGNIIGTRTALRIDH